ncbi:MAG: O-antigen ligase family protein [Novosphingobium sp.]
MNGSPRATATLAYLAAVLVLGGASAAGLSGNFLLQLLGAGLIGWTLWSAEEEPAIATGLRPFLIAVAALMALQFLPLPPGLWRLLPGREQVYDGFVTLGVAPPWLTLSLAPWKSLASFAWWLPALALFAALRAPGAPPVRHVVWTIGAVAALSAVIGAMQRGLGSGYFYLITNYGEGPGFFANSNHQGSFLLCALALWSGWLVSEREGLLRGGSGRLGVPPWALYALAGALLLGVLVSGSLACVALLAPVLAAIALIARPQLNAPPAALALGAVLVAAGFAAFLLYGPVANDLTAKGAVAGISRQEFLVTGARIAGDFAPFGSGVGTFQDLYRWYEDPALVTTTYVNHAHDDLLELLLETGLPGLAVLGVFLAWFVPRAWRLWTGERDRPLALAASVAIGVELLHSLVDYPLRTAAMSSLVAVACVLLVREPEVTARRRARRASDVGDAPREMIRI